LLYLLFAIIESVEKWNYIFFQFFVAFHLHNLKIERKIILRKTGNCNSYNILDLWCSLQDNTSRKQSSLLCGTARRRCPVDTLVECAFHFHFQKYSNRRLCAWFSKCTAMLSKFRNKSQWNIESNMIVCIPKHIVKVEKNLIKKLLSVMID
jgi:hypothetical protein